MFKIVFVMILVGLIGAVCLTSIPVITLVRTDFALTI